MKNILIPIILLMLAGCQTSGQEIRADISVKAQQDLNFSGLDNTVHSGIVDFTGLVPSEKAFAKIRQTIENIHVIKAVNYHVTISRVVLDTLTLVKMQADSLLAKYPRVTAAVYTGGLTLMGKVPAADKAGLLKAFHRPHIGRVKDSLQIASTASNE
jgi:hypothetical protein